MELGQVFTPPEVANFMVDLVADELKEDTKILDPCIGRNIFFDSLNSRASSFEFHGVEIDSTLLVESTRNVFQDSRNFLFEGNFFDFSTKTQFDYAILNPPFIRQEKILNKKKIFATLSASQVKVSKKSNMFLKGCTFRKQRRKLSQNAFFVNLRPPT